MSWDWQVFCRDTLTGDVVPGCYGHGDVTTYLNWMLSAWGWTISVSVCSLVLALAVGIFLVVELAKWATRRLYGASR